MNFLENARTITCGKLCHYGLRIFNELWNDRSKLTVCPICTEDLKLNDEFYLVVSNYYLFPNCIIHANCIIDKSSVEGLEWQNFNKATEYMHQNYQEYKSKYKAWIRE